MVGGADWIQIRNPALHWKINRLFLKAEGRKRSPSGEGIGGKRWSLRGNTPDGLTPLLRSCNPYRLTLAH